MSNFNRLHEEDSGRISSYPSIQMVPVQNYRPVVAPAPQPVEPERNEARENALRKVIRWETAICVVSIILIVSIFQCPPLLAWNGRELGRNIQTGF